jgi:hypothetical protein
MEIEQILKIYVAEAMPKITKCVFDEQRVQIKREILLEKLTTLFRQAVENARHTTQESPNR